ncbi:hypothetical protein CALCODRAFT_130424 [Calocera cornea HHB12733]|uniref:Uncharacterized protein n=1 Tax=Calocera cornea HHB12733 TaxID=1353952 RepID=A0A165IAP5_9BASI|nr:hypothetical protein CALCODRAFT_130424 [Calocera cornea HHB12733]
MALLSALGNLSSSFFYKLSSTSTLHCTTFTVHVSIEPLFNPDDHTRHVKRCTSAELLPRRPLGLYSVLALYALIAWCSRRSSSIRPQLLRGSFDLSARLGLGAVGTFGTELTPPLFPRPLKRALPGRVTSTTADSV